MAVSSGGRLLLRLTQSLSRSLSGHKRTFHLPTLQMQGSSPPLNKPHGLSSSSVFSPNKQMHLELTQKLSPPNPHTSGLQVRQMSNLPESTVYGGPQSLPTQRFNLRLLQRKYKAGEPVTMVTAYDYPSAVHVDSAGIDICLVSSNLLRWNHGI